MPCLEIAINIERGLILSEGTATKRFMWGKDESEPSLIILNLPNLVATERLGRKLASFLRPGDTIALEGDLGSGKTTLVRFILQAFGIESVPSPTFTLVQTYSVTIKGQKTELWHFDLYRLKRMEEAYDLAIEEAFNHGISLIEWPSRLGGLLPEDCLTITLSVLGSNARQVFLEGGKKWHSILEAIEQQMKQ